MSDLVPLPTPDELARLDAVVHDIERTVTLEDLSRSGRRRFRVVNRRALLLEVLSLVEVFLDARTRRLETEISEIVRRREVDARAEGRLRVLESLIDMADLADGLVQALAGTDGAAAAKALDRRIDSVFRTHGFARIPTVGEAFDSSIHEAVDENHDPDAGEGVVLSEVSRGYRSDGLVLRVARVVVNSKGTS